MENLKEIKMELEKQFKEREEEISGALLSLLAGENILFIGPPGTAKSLLAMKVCQSVDGGNFFYYLLTRFTTPDEIFGPLSLKSLQKDEFKRKIEGYIPTSHICFLDEIFKANSSILNSLLTILNERKFHNGREIINIPLLTVFGASNELPEKEESLEALYDRFLFRYSTGYIQDEGNFRELLFGSTETMIPQYKLNVQDINKIKENSREIKIENDVLESLLTLRRKLRSMNYHISDRRWKKILNTLKVASAAIKRSSVDRTMIPLLQHMMWDKPEQKDALKPILIDLTISGGISLDKLKKDVDDLKAVVDNAKDYQFPKGIHTYRADKEKIFNSSKEFIEYAMKNPNTRYLNPYHDQSSWSSSYYNFNDLIEELKKHGWTFAVSISENQLKLYKKEHSELKTQYDTVKDRIFNERESLQQLIETNIWLSNKDRHDILMNYDNKIKTLHKIEDDLKEIEKGMTAGEEKIEIPVIKSR